MKIAVVGSYDEKDLGPMPFLLSFEEFKSACVDLGRSLSQAGHSIDVQYDRIDSADRYVVQGYIDGLKSTGASDKSISIWRPSHQNGTARSFENALRDFPEVFRVEPVHLSRWHSTLYRMCSKADATIAIGGRSKTETSGYLALASGKPLIPIACFGGAAEVLLANIESLTWETSYLPGGLTPEHLKRICSNSLTSQIASSLNPKRPTLVVIHGRNMSAVNQLVEHITPLWGKPTLMLWDYQPGETLLEKWQRVAGDSNSIAIAIASADDIGYCVHDARRFRRTKRNFRARQNVWLEVGWFWGMSRSPKRLMILPQIAASGIVECPSDLQGLEYHVWEKTPLEQKDQIKAFLKAFETVT